MSLIPAYINFQVRARKDRQSQTE